MWATLALATALSLAPAQSDTLQLKNDRPTYGELGQERKDSKLLPGDIFVVAFDIEGLKSDDNGKVSYSMSLDLLNKEGKSQFKQEPADLDTFNALGGNRVPAYAQATIGTDTPPGEYTMKVTVKDRASGKSATLSRAFEVMPMKFGFIRLGLFYLYPNIQGAPPAPPVAVPGQTYAVAFTVVGAELEKARRDQPNVEAVLRVLDEEGKPVLAKPNVGVANDVPPELRKHIQMVFTVQINRAGKFKLELKATDKVSGKTATQLLDLAVVETK